MSGTERKKTFAALAGFVKEGLWEIHTEEMGRLKRGAVKAMRFCSLILSRLKSNRCNLHAASLTFFSLMALVPVLAMTLAMARAFGGGELAKQKIYAVVETWTAELESNIPAVPAVADGKAESGTAVAAPDVSQTPTDVSASAAEVSLQMRKLADELLSQLDNISFGTLGGIGAVMLLWTVIGTLEKVETSFNEVWNVRKGRTLARKAADYLFAIIVLPFLCLAASTIPVVSALSGMLTKALGERGQTILAFLTESPLTKAVAVVMFGGIFFSFLIGFMPNTKVRAKAAITGGFVTAVLFSIWLKLCTMLQIGIGQYSTLYGGFATLPILLAWLFMSWKIVLVGAEIAFATQHCSLFFYSSVAEKISMRTRIAVALLLVAAAARLSVAEKPQPLDATAFAKRKRIPRSVCLKVVNELVNIGMLVKVDDDSEGNYVLCGDGSKLRICDVVAALMNSGAAPNRAGLGRSLGCLDEQFRRFDEKIAALDAPVLEIQE